MTTIYLIRHGQASIGTSNYDVLSKLGHRQSAVLGSYFERTNVRFDQIISGTLQRQIDTARISMGQKSESLMQYQAFNEYQHSTIYNHYAKLMAHENEKIARTLAAGHNTKLTYDVFATLMNTWASDTRTYPDLESWAQFNERISRGLTTILDNKNKQQRIAIFTSGGVICTILQSIANFPTQKIFELNWGIYNASVTIIKSQASTLKLSTYNSIAHLELENDGSLITNI